MIDTQYTQHHYAPSITKEELEQLPKAVFPAKLHLIDQPELVASAIEELITCNLIGFDTETRPSFKKGVLHEVALLQLSTEEDCYLFRLNQIGLPVELISLFENEKIFKIGLSINDDIRSLHRTAKFTPQSFIELQRMCPAYGIKDASLQKIYAIIYKERMSKTQRLTNWEAKELTLAQQEYAALDAWASLRIFLDLMQQPHPSPIQFAVI